MPSNSITLKPANHTIYQCPTDKKIDLVKHLIEENSSLETLVVCSENAQQLKESLANENIRVMEDRELVKEKLLSCEFLISYDMPIKAIVYIARVAKATKKAVMLLDEDEQRGVHSIETLLGRAIKQDAIEGFMYPVVEKKEEPKYKKLSKDEITQIAKQRHEDATVEKPKREFKKEHSKDKKSFDKKPFDKKSFDKKDDKWAKKKKAPNKFLGKDENGKAIFSGKSGERNHRYDGTPRDKWDAPKKVGKTINIKARKPKEEE